MNKNNIQTWYGSYRTPLSYLLARSLTLVDGGAVIVKVASGN